MPKPLFIRGDYDTAVFRAFKEVEVRVRRNDAGLHGDYGVDLMKKAFGPNGPLMKRGIFLKDQSVGLKTSPVPIWLEGGQFAGPLGAGAPSDFLRRFVSSPHQVSCS